MGNKTSKQDGRKRKKKGCPTYFLGSAEQNRRFRKPRKNSLDSPPPYHESETDEQSLNEEAVDQSLNDAYQAMKGIVERIDEIGITTTILEISLLMSTSKVSLPKDKWEPAKDICNFLRKNNRQDLIHSFLKWCLYDTIQQDYDQFVFQSLNSM